MASPHRCDPSAKNHTHTPKAGGSSSDTSAARGPPSVPHTPKSGCWMRLVWALGSHQLGAQAHVDSHHASFGRIRPNLAESGLISAEPNPRSLSTSAMWGRIRPTRSPGSTHFKPAPSIDQHRPDCGQMWSDFDQQPSSAHIGLSTKIGTESTKAEFGCRELPPRHPHNPCGGHLAQAIQSWRGGGENHERHPWSRFPSDGLGSAPWRPSTGPLRVPSRADPQIVPEIPGFPRHM